MRRFRIRNSSERLRQYLVSRGYLARDEPAEITQLGGGVANDVFKVQSSAGAAVFKQALSRIRVESHWVIDAQRSNVEKDALKIMRRILGPTSVPAVIFEDEENFIFGIECAPQGSEEWKKRLLRGDVDFKMARQVARSLARIHNRTFESDEVLGRFDQQQRFLECRVKPYYETIARRHPELAGPIQAEIARVLSVRKVLVHADYSPKNILVLPGSGRFWVLDPEAAHLGDPSFDIAFLLNHMLLKAVRVRRSSATLLQAFFHMARAYASEIRVFPSGWIEERACRGLGLLLLARVDGKSPAEYLGERERDIVRRSGTRVILERPRRYPGVAEIVSEEMNTTGEGDGN